LGSPLGDHQARRRVGFLPEHFRFHDWLTAAEFLGLHADLYQMSRQTIGSRIQQLLELVGLSAYADQKLRQFSKGMLQRIGLAQALLNQPDVVILDEPTSGLDPVGRRLVRDIIKDIRQAGTRFSSIRTCSARWRSPATGWLSSNTGKCCASARSRPW